VEFDSDPHSTELIARQLLNPTVSENEVAEYHGLVIHVTVPPFQLIFSHRYIDQCQDLLDAPINGGERKDLEVYQRAVWTATGELPEWPNEAPDDAFHISVEREATNYLDQVGRKEALAVHLSYERWLGGSVQRI
jgi:phosphatidylinositol 3,5-bisphosphate 5-phosphatase